MIDFFTIPDKQPQEEFSELESAAVGSLHLQTLIRLKRKGLVPKELNGFSDFRWNARQVSKLLAEAQAPPYQRDTDAMQLCAILIAARESELGVIAFAD